MVELVEVVQKSASPPLSWSDHDLVVALGEVVLSSYHLRYRRRQLAVPGQSP